MATNEKARGCRHHRALNLFWEGHDRLRPRQLALESTVLDFEFPHARIDRLGRRASLVRTPSAQLALLALAPPVRQMRAVQALAPQQRAQRPGLLARVGFPENAAPILRGELPALDLGRYFRVGGRGAQRGRGAGGSGRPPGSLRPLGHVHVYSCWHAIHPSNLPRPYTNLRGQGVSPINGTGGLEAILPDKMTELTNAA